MKDDAPVLEAFAAQWRAFSQHRDPGALCRAVLARADFWGEDLSSLPDLVEAIGAHLSRILQLGVREAIGMLP